MFTYRLVKIKNMLCDIVFYALQHSYAKELASQSLLWDLTDDRNPVKICPLCVEDDLQHLIDLPIGWPMPQNDYLLYYDYNNPDFDKILKAKEIIFRTGGFFLTIRWSFCLSCQNVSLAVKFTDSHLNVYYAKYYRRLASSSQKRKNTKEVYAKYIDSLIGRNSKLLELGSAEGYAVSYLAKQGHNIWAVEPSAFSNVAFRAKNITLVEDIEGLERDFFDCIYLHHVLEHLSEPVSFLKKAHGLLKKGGLLVIQVPDIFLQMEIYLRSLRLCHYALLNPVRYNRKILDTYFPQSNGGYYWMDAFANNHLYAFSPYGLKYLLEKYGFEVKEVKQTKKGDLFFDKDNFMWPVDKENGSTPNGLTVVADK